jgi:hypothetical protein
VKAWWDTEPDTPEPPAHGEPAPEIDERCSMCGATSDLIYGPCWPILADRPYSGTRCYDGVECRKRQQSPKPKEGAEALPGDAADMLGSTEDPR